MLLHQIAVLARSERGRKKWREELDHFQNRLRKEPATPIPATRRTVEEIRVMLGKKKDEDCTAVAFSINRRLLAVVGDIDKILVDVIATDIGAIVSIVPGKIAIYWGEEPDAKGAL